VNSEKRELGKSLRGKEILKGGEHVLRLLPGDTKSEGIETGPWLKEREELFK